jgi:hypothetical protein
VWCRLLLFAVGVFRKISISGLSWNFGPFLWKDLSVSRRSRVLGDTRSNVMCKAMIVIMAQTLLVAFVSGTAAAPGSNAFGFSSVMGDWMVLQQAPAAAAVYGPVSAGGTGVTVTVSDGTSSYTVEAKVGKDATHQPYGYVDPKTGAQLPVISETWKAVLHPTAAGGDYTITAKCTGCSNGTTATLSHVTFGDMFYCSGQSNMWLPVQYTFSRNKTVAAIAAGKYTNIRGMFSPSATTPTGGVWKTAMQAIQDGNATSPTYSLFDMVTQPSSQSTPSPQPTVATRSHSLPCV